ncbi:hypothetical protein [Bradyrhizobium macuxiense]|uniref:hypothetical protein n=1 Tax=Bradyrhizobium macuxiense TaxID=1755647 RepID=UPI000AB16D5E|nr:hypothetical protein [Bradyrhizobium macuxiense]
MKLAQRFGIVVERLGLTFIAVRMLDLIGFVAFVGEKMPIDTWSGWTGPDVAVYGCVYCGSHLLSRMASS